MALTRTESEAAKISTYKDVVDALDGLVRFFTEGYKARDHLAAWLYSPDDGGLDLSSYRPLLEKARSELYEYRRAEEINPPNLYDTESEDYVLINSALRIDGYKYQDSTDLNAQAIIDHYIAHSEWLPSNELDLLATFFLMQRYLYKWGGDMLPKTSPEWKVFRSLFLTTTNVEVPDRYILNDVWAESWKYRIKPRLEFYAAIVSMAHEETDYDG